VLRETQRQRHLGQSGDILSKALVIIGVVDGPRWVVGGQVFGASLTVNVVVGGTVDGEVGGLADKSSGPGIGTSVGDVPETAADVDNSEFIGI